MLAGEPTDGGAVVSDLLDLLLLRFLFLLFCWTEEASATGVEAATGGGVTPRRGLTTGAANFFAGSFPFLIFFFVTWTADVKLQTQKVVRVVAQWKLKASGMHLQSGKQGTELKTSGYKERY